MMNTEVKAAQYTEKYSSSSFNSTLYPGYTTLLDSLKKDHPNYKYISTQNKVNYILCKEEDEALGVYCLLNSTIYDL